MPVNHSTGLVVLLPIDDPMDDPIEVQPANYKGYCDSPPSPYATMLVLYCSQLPKDYRTTTAMGSERHYSYHYTTTQYF